MGDGLEYTLHRINAVFQPEVVVIARLKRPSDPRPDALRAPSALPNTTQPILRPSHNISKSEQIADYGDRRRAACKDIPRRLDRDSPDRHNRRPHPRANIA